MNVGKLVKVNNVQEISKSKYIAIPQEMWKALNISKGDGMAFFWNDKKTEIIIKKVG
jgi:bifunctional DNA-binding transcriptional regulator/antitoxin component of YhaV-PrlF toxin-antitoxin module